MSQQSSFKWKYKRDKRRVAKPYSRPGNESMITNVASVVKDKLIPGWLKNVANYLLPTTSSDEPEIVESSNELNQDHHDLGPTINHNASSNIRMNTGLTFRRELNPEANSRESLNQPTSSGLASGTNQTVAKSLGGMDRNDVVIDEEASSTTSNTASSTSGCSSLVPSHQDNLLQKINFPGGKNSLEMLRKELLKKTRDVAVETEAKSSLKPESSQSFLWSSNSVRRRDFDVSNFFAPSSIVTDKNKSPFYEGKTCFGGASAKRARLFVNSPYSDKARMPSIVRVKINEAKKVENNLSNTAKRILANMEKMSSPLEDAKKAPVYSEPSESLKLGLNNTSSLLSASFGLGRKRSYEVSARHSSIPTPKFVAKPTPVLEPATKDANVGGKIRARVSKPFERVSCKPLPVVEEQTLLPTMALPIKSLPTFDFSPFMDGHSAAKSSTPIKKGGTVVEKIDVSRNNKAEFSFAPPVLPQRQNVCSSNATVSHKAPAVSFTKPVEANGTARHVNSAIQIENVLNSQIHGTLADKTVPTTNASQSQQEKQTTVEISSWSCHKCMFKNPQSKSVCPACFSKKPCDESKESTETNNSAKLDHPAKASASTDINTDVGATHLKINNTSSQNSTARKDDNQENTTKVDSKANDATNVIGWGSKFRPQSDTWECDTCFVRNKSSDNACIACEMPKPGRTTVDVKQAYSGFNFGNVDTKSTAPTFNFGFAPGKDLKNEEKPEKKEELPGNKLEGFGGFSKTSPTMTISTSVGYQAAQHNFSTTNSGFAFGSLSSTSNTNVVTVSLNSSKPIDSPIVSQSSKNTDKDAVGLTPTGGATFQSKPFSSTPTFNFGAIPTSEPNSDSKKDQTSGVESKSLANNTFKFDSKMGGSTTDTSTAADKDEPPSKFSRTPTTPFVFGNAAKADDNLKSSLTSFASTTSHQPTSVFSVTTVAATTASDISNNFSDKKNVAVTTTATELFKQPVFGSITTTTDATKPTAGFCFGAGFSGSSASSTALSPFGAKPSAATTSSPVTDASKNMPSGGFKFSVAPTPPTTTGFLAGATNPLFGSAVSSATSLTTGANSNPPKTTSGFTFGGTSTASNTGFAFGSRSQIAVTTPSAAPPTAPTFSFGEKTSTAPTFAFGAAAKTSSTGFSFGQNQSLPSTSTFAFGSVPTTTSNSTSQGFNFSGPLATGAEVKPPAFGQNSNPTQFQFGQALQQPASGLQFGAPAQLSAAQPSLAAPQLNLSQMPNFNFGGQDSAGGVFQFGASGSDQVNNGGGSVIQRNIKKAKRRLGRP